MICQAHSKYLVLVIGPSSCWHIYLAEYFESNAISGVSEAVFSITKVGEGKLHERDCIPRKMPAKRYWARKLSRRWGVRYQLRTKRTNSTLIWKNQLVAGLGSGRSLLDSPKEIELCPPTAMRDTFARTEGTSHALHWQR